MLKFSDISFFKFTTYQVSLEGCLLKQFLSEKNFTVIFLGKTSFYNYTFGESDFFMFDKSNHKLSHDPFFLVKLAHKNMHYYTFHYIYFSFFRHECNLSFIFFNTITSFLGTHLLNIDFKIAIHIKIQTVNFIVQIT